MIQRYLLFQIILVIVGLVGGIYTLYYRKDRLDFKKIWIFILIMLLLSPLDIITTFFFVRDLGIDAEGNAIAEIFMHNFGVVWGLILMRILSIGWLFLFSCWIYSHRDKRVWVWFFLTMIIISLLIPVWNLI